MPPIMAFGAVNTYLKSTGILNVARNALLNERAESPDAPPAVIPPAMIVFGVFK